MRIKDHPILDFSLEKQIPFVFEGQAMIGVVGDSIASALVSNGIKIFSYSSQRKRPRGFYCAIGNCGACNMIVDGRPNVRTCITPLEANMVVELQRNKGVLLWKRCLVSLLVGVRLV